MPLCEGAAGARFGETDTDGPAAAAGGRSAGYIVRVNMPHHSQ